MERSSNIDYQSTNLVDIPFEELIIGESIGAGGFGQVFKAQWHGQNVAVKSIKFASLISSSSESLLNESRKLMRLHHKHVILSMGTSQKPNVKEEIMLVMEYMKHGSLQDLLFPKGLEPVKLKPFQIIQFALDIAKGLNYLHCLTPKIIHRDLKCANILLYHNKTRAKISDFGTARYLNKNSIANTFQGTIGYVAPEMFEDDQEHDEKADVYSFGIVLLVLATSSQNLPTSRDKNKFEAKIEEMLKSSTSMANDHILEN